MNHCFSKILNILIIMKLVNLKVINDKIININKNRKNIDKQFKIIKLKEIESLDFIIKNLNNQILILNKKYNDRNNELFVIKNNYLEHLKKNINPEFLCNICFENRINLF